MSTPLIADQITSQLGTAARGLQIEVLASTPSTNADLRARTPHLSAPLLLAAENQTAGRGRAGRSWNSAIGVSLCFSLAWPFEGAIHRLTGLPLAVGVAVANALQRSGWPVQLKWPNDLLLDGAKLGGVLIESATYHHVENVSRVWAVIGVGINVHPNAQRDATIDYSTACLSSQALDRNILLAKLADALCEMCVEFNLHGLRSFIDRWHELHAYQDQQVLLHENGKLLHQGIARGINADGCLLLDTADAHMTISAGDISLRSAHHHSPSRVTHAATD